MPGLIPRICDVKGLSTLNNNEQIFDELRISDDGRHLVVVDHRANRLTDLRGPYITGSQYSATGESYVSVQGAVGAPFRSRRSFASRSDLDAYATSVAKLAASVRCVMP